MERLTTEELLDLQEEILARLPEVITTILVTLNTNERLEDLLRLLDMEDLIEIEETLEAWPEGRVVVFGDAQAKPKDLYGVAKSLGIARDRIEFVSHDEAKRYNYRQLEYNHAVVAVLFGAVPHSTTGKGDASSAIANMERRRDAYPKVIRLSANGSLKITKTNFRESLESLIDSGLLAA